MDEYIQELISQYENDLQQGLDQFYGDNDPINFGLLEAELLDIKQYISYEKYRHDVNVLFNIANLNWQLDDKGFFSWGIPAELKNELDDVGEILKGEYDAAYVSYVKATNFLKGTPPDPENAVKEIYLALEGVAKTIFPEADALGKCIKEMENNGKYHKHFVDIIFHFHKFASDKSGIRHAQPRIPPNTTMHEAEFCLYLGSALINFLNSQRKL